MTISEQKQVNDSKLIEYANRVIESVNRENYQTVDDFATLIAHISKQQRLLVNAKPIWPPMPRPSLLTAPLADPSDAIKRGNDMIETYGCHVIGGAE